MTAVAWSTLLLALALLLATPPCAAAPAISVSPDSLDFGVQAVGTSSSERTITVTNTGDSTFQVTGLSNIGGNITDFLGTEVCSGLALAPGQTCQIYIFFRPMEPGPRSTTLTIITSTSGVIASVDLRGNGTGGKVSLALAPSALEFGRLRVGDVSAEQAVTVTSTGDAAVTVHGVTIGGSGAGSFRITAGGGGTLAPGASLMIHLAFSPASSGAHSALIVIQNSAPGSPHTVSISGTGFTPTPAARLSDTSLSFGSQTVGTPSAEQRLTLSNTGEAPLSIASIDLDGSHPGSFSITTGGGGGTVPPGGSHTFGLTFVPRETGRQSARLVIATNAPDSPHTIALSGTGYTPAPAARLSDTSISFGSQTVGTPSAEQQVTLSNTGDAPLSITGVSLDGSDPGSFSITTGGGAGGVLPGGRQTIGVAFIPRETGRQGALLVIATNAPGSPHTVALTGTGITPTPAARLSDTSLSFGSQAVGTPSPEQRLTLSNTGEAPLSITSVSLDGSGAASFSITTGGGGGAVPPGSSQTFGLTFVPRETGRQSARLVIATDAPGSPHTVSLSGTGTQPPPPPRGTPRLLINPVNLQFSDQTVGTGSAPQTVLLMNTGTAPLVIRSVTVAGINRADFAVSEGGGGITVPEGGSRNVTVVFTPTGTGKRTASLVVSDNATSSPNEVPLEGTGIAAPPIVGDWSVNRHDPRHLGLAEAALDPRPLQPWSFPLDGRPGGVVVRGGVAYVGTETGSLVAVDVRTRADLWRRSLPNPIRSSPAVGAHGLVVSARGLFCLAAAGGSVRWQRADVIAEPEVSPMLAGEVVYVAAPVTPSAAPPDRQWVIHAIDPRNGRNAWPVPALLPEGYDARATVAAYPEMGLLFVCLRPAGIGAQAGLRTGAVLALRLIDGGRAWAVPATLPSPAAPGGIVVGWVAKTTSLPVPQPAVFVTAGASVTAFHALTGAPLWTRALPETMLPGSPALSTAAPQAGVIYLGGASGRLYALDTTTGADVPGQVVEAGSPVTGPLTLAGDFLFVPTTTGPTAVELKSGSRAWSYPLGEVENLAVAAGGLFATTADGRLVGFLR